MRLCVAHSISTDLLTIWAALLGAKPSIPLMMWGIPLFNHLKLSTVLRRKLQEGYRFFL